MIWKLLSIIFLVLSEFLCSSHGWSCFVCNSAFDKDCEVGPPAIEYLVECNINTAQPLMIKHEKLTIRKNPNVLVLPTTNNNDDASNGHKSSNSSKDPSNPVDSIMEYNVTSSTTLMPENHDRKARNVVGSIETNTGRGSRLEIDKDSYKTNINFTFCRKTLTNIPRQHNHDNIKEKDYRIIRSCGWIQGENKMNTCKWSDGGEIQNEYCICNSKNACNHGVSTFITTSTTSVTIYSLLSSTLMIIMANLTK